MNVLLKIRNNIIFSLLVIGMASCSPPKDDDLEKFNNYLGKEKAEALNQLVASFEDFINTNFDTEFTEGEKIQEFLKILAAKEKPDSGWVFKTEKNTGILAVLEKTGMRLEIMRYDHEVYEPEDFLSSNFTEQFGGVEYTVPVHDSVVFEDLIEIPDIDYGEDSLADLESRKRKNSRPYSNINGRYLLGLAKFKSSDSLIWDYIEAKFYAGDISPHILIDAFLVLFSPEDFKDPFIKRMIVVEIYLDLILIDIKEKSDISFFPVLQENEVR